MRRMKAQIAVLAAVAATVLLVPVAAHAFSYTFTWGAQGTALGQFNNPWSIAVSPAPDNRVFVLDSNNFRIQRFKLDGTSPFVFPGGGLGTADGQLAYPQGIAVANGLVYVADTGNSRVEVFTLDGGFVRKWGAGEGVGNDQLNHPAGIAVDPQPGGLVYVTDSRNHRVQVFSPEGFYAKTIGEPGDADGHFTVPSGIAVFEGHVYVADEQLTKIQRF
jgi:DNA-binding beta-propeller fold protein YncE